MREAVSLTPLLQLLHRRGRNRNKKGKQGSEKKGLTISTAGTLFSILLLVQNSCRMLSNSYK